ncbi:hypothetical protein H4Q32_030630 [Labeo rohita]|uniref:Uncharacterized protein n=1 Tax=Labeo rohita TaxID=84645 RepID=A0ABQ8L288_LABRO|nr:hypothetical protein H4Q32_030630 [Labeo rohita]
MPRDCHVLHQSTAIAIREQPADLAGTVSSEQSMWHDSNESDSSFTVGIADEEPCYPPVPTAPEHLHVPTVMSGVVHIMPAKAKLAYIVPATPGPAHVMPAKPGPGSPESLRKMAVCTETLSQIAASPESLGKMSTTSDSSAKMPTTLEFRHTMTITSEPASHPEELGSGLTRLIASLMDQPLMSVQVDGIPGISMFSSLTDLALSSPMGIPFQT